MKTPLSTDVLVWPSIFDQGTGIGLDPETRRACGLLGPSLPTWVGQNSPYWDDLAALRKFIETSSIDAVTTPFQLVAVTRLRSEDEPELAPDSSWEFLGFDVSDGGMISGLMNCGYLDDAEIEVARREWASRVNASHLFDTVADAERFAITSNERVVEHAPFQPYGLWRVNA